MREILFRAKPKYPGEGRSIDIKTCPAGWLVGEFHQPIKNDDTCVYVATWHAIPETVGEYTGMLDSNGAKIFEGDLLTFPKDNDRKWFVCFRKGSFYAASLNGIGKEDWSDVSQVSTYWWGDEGNGVPTIVGNIHDNPELLEKGAK